MEKHPRILIVDDSPSVRAFIRRVLEPLQAEMGDAENGLDAYDLLTGGGYDLVLTDNHMPDMDGMQLCRQLKRNLRTRGLPVIMISSFDTEDEIDEGFQAGASAYVSKKEISRHLLETVSRCLVQSRIRKRRTILVVDDSTAIRAMVTEGLEASGFRVIGAENGRRGLERLIEDKPDLLLSDIDMPEMNGFELCRAVHRDIGLSKTPVVIMSSHGDRASMNRMIFHGASGYIVKPFNINQLILMIEKILSDQFRLLMREKERLSAEKQVLVGSIASLVTALEARDAYTRGHSESVSRIVTGMMSLANPDPDELEMISLAGKLHDVGKIGVRDNILLKPGRLTSEEFAQIQEHPTMGAIIIKPIPSLANIATVVLSHHERLDGKGYPQGLKGEEIHLWARMTSVADTFDALTSDRPYRKGMPWAMAFQILEDIKGTQLCPDSLALFMRWIQTDEARQDRALPGESALPPKGFGEEAPEEETPEEEAAESGASGAALSGAG